MSLSWSRRSGGTIKWMDWPIACADGPAEQTLRASVPGGDHAVECLADDGVFGRRHDGGEQRLRLDFGLEREVGRRELVLARFQLAFRALQRFTEHDDRRTGEQIDDESDELVDPEVPPR